MAIADLLLPYNIVAFLGSNPISVYRFRSQIISFPALAIAVYSTLAVDSTGVISFLELHIIMPPFRMNTLPLVKVKSWLLAKLALAYP